LKREHTEKRASGRSGAGKAGRPARQAPAAAADKDARRRPAKPVSASKARAGASGGGAAAAPGRRIGIALAGGGPLGAIYEIGAVSALAEALEGIDFNDLYVYVGVSAGGFLAAGLANGMTPGQMARMFIESDAAEEPFHPEMLLRPAFREYASRLLSLPPLLLGALWKYASHPLDPHFMEAFQQLSRAIPTGIFNNEGIDEFLQRLFRHPGRSNDFRDLSHKLFLVATDLDSGESVPFGAPGWDDVPISRAVQASAALPGLYPPVEIDGHCYVDGALRKTLHASVALKEGADLVLCVNPLVPFDAALAAEHGHPSRHRLVEGGLPLVLSQTFRAIIHSRMQVGMGKYASEFSHADVVLFEPNRDDADMFFTNVFSYASRRRLSEHGYQKTRAELFRRRHELAPVLARHGIGIRLEVLQDESRRLLGPRMARRRLDHGMDAMRALGRCLDDLTGWLSRDVARRRSA
jgi:predicted acylesterase/phospholipase RssA